MVTQPGVGVTTDGLVEHSLRRVDNVGHRGCSHMGEGAGLMNYSVLPPEINSLRMFTGAGSAPMLAASVAWDRLAAELAVAASSFGSVTSGLAGQSWQGAAAAMAAAAAPYAGWLAAAAARAAGASAQAKAVASAFEAARAATVHPMLVAANRNAFVQLVLSNLFGQNAPAIAAAEAMYEQMWAADVAAMVGYHGGASAAAAVVTQPGVGVTTDGLVEHSLRRVDNVGHRGCSHMVGHGIRLLDDGVHRGNFGLYRPFAGQDLVDLLIAGLCDLGQPIPQIVHRIGDLLALVAFDLALMRDGG